MQIVVILIVVAIILAVVAVPNMVMRRKGYAMPGETPVRCSKGHLFKTLWVEGGSLRAIKLGPTTRYQYCPVGKHWAIIHPVKEQDLTPEDRQTLASQ